MFYIHEHRKSNTAEQLETERESERGFLSKKALWLLSLRKGGHNRLDCLQDLITARTKSLQEGTLLTL